MILVSGQPKLDNGYRLQTFHWKAGERKAGVARVTQNYHLGIHTVEFPSIVIKRVVATNRRRPQRIYELGSTKAIWI